MTSRKSLRKAAGSARPVIIQVWDGVCSSVTVQGTVAPRRSLYK